MTATLYLDIDGTFSPIQDWSRLNDLDTETSVDAIDQVWPQYVEHGMLVFAPALTDAIDALRAETGLRLVWNTSWLAAALDEEFVTEMGGPRGGEFPAWPNGARNPKEDIVRADQAAHPGPFIWADDDGRGRWDWTGTFRHKRVFPTARTWSPDGPHLLLTPKPHTGLTPDHVTEMRDFLDAQR